jgi:hypothetical protein
VDIPATTLVDIPPSKLETSVALCCVSKLHILEWPFIVLSTSCTCVMIMLFKQLLDMPHLSGGWIVLAKEKCSLTGMKHICSQNLREISFFLCIENVWDILFQVMKHGSNTLHVVFILMFSIHKNIK